MRIAIIAPGSRGDVQPYIALGKGLKNANNTVRLISNQNFENLANSHGVEFHPIEISSQEIIQTEKMRKVLEEGKLLTSMIQMGKEMKENAIKLAERSLAACQNVDVVIAGIGSQFVALSIAEKLDIPFLPAYNIPFNPTKDFPGVLFPDFPSWFKGSFTLLSHQLSRQMVWQAYRPSDKLVRCRVLNLPKSSFWGPFKSEYLQDGPIIYGLSPSVIPQPSDWADNIHITGYWFLDEPKKWNPPSDLLEFINSGSPPVYIGFGSMSNRKPEEITKLVSQALEYSNQRAILQKGWSGLQEMDLPDSIFMVESVSHSWLFPRVKAVVHHGGAGTTAAGLRSGVPSIIVPYHGDQSYWGKLVAEIGVGPSPIPRKKLSAQSLSKAIQETEKNQKMRQEATKLGLKIQAENGVTKAVAIIKQLEENGFK